MKDKLAPSRVLQRRKVAKKMKKPKSTNPIRVVYISSPMKFKASVSDFRALVQEFTGQDAEFPDHSKFPVSDEDFSGDRKIDILEAKKGFDDCSPDPVAAGAPIHDVPESSITQYEPFDDIFNSDQMIENLSGVWPSNLLFEPSPVVDVLRSL